MAKNFYEVLGVNKNATQDEIKLAYRKLVKQYHPDLHPNDANAAAKMKEINEANETLSDEQRRSQYDYELDHPGASNFGFGGAGGFAGFGDIFGDIFSAFSGGGAAQQDTTGADITKEISISFLDAAKGCAKEISYTRNAPCEACHGTGAKDSSSYTRCTNCNGTGQIKYTQQSVFGTSIRMSVCPHCNGTGKKITKPCEACAGKGYTKQDTRISFNIPAGADTNSYIRKKGYGQASTKGGSSGDLIIIIKVEPHPFFKRRDRDIYVEVPVPFWTAALGGKIKIPSVDEMVDYEIKEGTQSGTIYMLKGKGIKTKMGAGNLYATVVVETPSKISKEQRKKLESFASSVDAKQLSKVKAFKDSVENLYGENPYK